MPCTIWQPIFLPLDFIAFVTTNTFPNGRSESSHGCLSYFSSYFERIDPPLLSEKDYDKKMKSFVITEFNHAQNAIEHHTMGVSILEVIFWNYSHLWEYVHTRMITVTHAAAMKSNWIAPYIIWIHPAQNQGIGKCQGRGGQASNLRNKQQQSTVTRGST